MRFFWTGIFCCFQVYSMQHSVLDNSCEVNRQGILRVEDAKEKLPLYLNDFSESFRYVRAYYSSNVKDYSYLPKNFSSFNKLFMPQNISRVINKSAFDFECDFFRNFYSKVIAWVTEYNIGGWIDNFAFGLYIKNDLEAMDNLYYSNQSTPLSSVILKERDLILNFIKSLRSAFLENSKKLLIVPESKLEYYSKPCSFFQVDLSFILKNSIQAIPIMLLKEKFKKLNIFRYLISSDRDSFLPPISIDKSVIAVSGHEELWDIIMSFTFFSLRHNLLVSPLEGEIPLLKKMMMVCNMRQNNYKLKYLGNIKTSESRAVYSLLALGGIDAELRSMIFGGCTQNNIFMPFPVYKDLSVCPVMSHFKYLIIRFLMLSMISSYEMTDFKIKNISGQAENLFESSWATCEHNKWGILEILKNKVKDFFSLCFLEELWGHNTPRWFSVVLKAYGELEDKKLPRSTSDKTENFYKKVLDFMDFVDNDFDDGVGMFYEPRIFCYVTYRITKNYFRFLDIMRDDTQEREAHRIVQNLGQLLKVLTLSEKEREDGINSLLMDVIDPNDFINYSSKEMCHLALYLVRQNRFDMFQFSIGNEELLCNNLELHKKCLSLLSHHNVYKEFINDLSSEFKSYSKQKAEFFPLGALFNFLKIHYFDISEALKNWRFFIPKKECSDDDARGFFSAALLQLGSEELSEEDMKIRGDLVTKVYMQGDLNFSLDEYLLMSGFLSDKINSLASLSFARELLYQGMSPWRVLEVLKRNYKPLLDIIAEKYLDSLGIKYNENDFSNVKIRRVLSDALMDSGNFQIGNFL